MSVTALRIASRPRDFVRVSGSDAARHLQAMVSNDVEALGLLKMDFLGLRNLDVIDKAVELVGGDVDITAAPLDDRKRQHFTVADPLCHPPQFHRRRAEDHDGREKRQRGQRRGVLADPVGPHHHLDPVVARRAGEARDPQLEAAISSMETAYRMQTEAPELLDLGNETPAELPEAAVRRWITQ